VCVSVCVCVCTYLLTCFLSMDCNSGSLTAAINQNTPDTTMKKGRISMAAWREPVLSEIAPIMGGLITSPVFVLCVCVCVCVSVYFLGGMNKW
jgi:hypothetical protein